MQERQRREEWDRAAQMKDLQDQARRMVEEEGHRHRKERQEDQKMMARLAEEVRSMREQRMGPKENEGWEERRVEDQWVPRPAPTEEMRKRFVPDNAAGRKSQEEMGLPRNLFARERLEDAMEDGKRSFKMHLDVGWGAQSASRASDRDWKAAQADLDRAKLPEIRPGKALWNGSWYGLEEAIVNPVVQGGLRDSGQEWTLAMCLSDNMDISVAAMMGWSFPFPPKPGRMSTTGSNGVRLF